MSRVSLDDLLHDSVLVSINYAWDTSIVTIVYSSFENDKELQKKILIKDVKEIIISQNLPWGKSNFVNGGFIEGNKIEIEMQSGDVIKAVGQIHLDN